MYRGDVTWALVALLVLWLTILFVFFEVAMGSATPGVIVALAIFAGLVLLFNTASILGNCSGPSGIGVRPGTVSGRLRWPGGQICG